MSTRIHSASALEVNVSTEMGVDAYFGGYVDRFADEADRPLDDTSYRFVWFEDRPRDEAWVWETTPREVAKLITRLQTVHQMMLDREQKVADFAKEQAGREKPPVSLDGDPGDLGDADVAGEL